MGNSTGEDNFLKSLGISPGSGGGGGGSGGNVGTMPFIRPVTTNNYLPENTLCTSTFAPWTANTTYTSGTIIFPSTFNGWYYTCTTAGTSAPTQPTFPTTENATVNDGAAVWTAHTFLGMSYLTNHVVTTWCSDPQLLFANFLAADDTQKAPNAIIVKAAIETMDGLVYEATFGGQQTYTITPGGVIESDKIGIELKPGDFIRVRTYVSVSSAGQKWPLNMFYPNNLSVGFEGGLLVDQAYSSKASWVSVLNVMCYGPIGIVGNIGMVDKPGVLLVGDSIMAGGNDPRRFQRSYVPTDGGGFCVRGLRDSVGFIRIALSGEQGASFSGHRKQFRIKLAKYCNVAIINYGANDLTFGTSTLAEFQESYLALWKALADRGLKVFQTTILPNTTSTDAWTTTANQTPYNANYGPGECIRTELNDWFMTLPKNLSGVIDVANTVESAPKSGKWNPNLTGDGLHPSNGVVNMAYAFSMSQLGVSKYVRIADAFTRSSNGTSPGIANTGQAWNVVVGTFGINSGQYAYASSAVPDSVMVIDSGASDGIVQGMAWVKGPEMHIVFRFTDANNYWAIQPDTTAGNPYRIRKKVAGVWFTVVPTTTNSGFDAIQVVLDGSSITLFINGKQIANVSDSFNQSATQHGLGVDNSTNINFLNFAFYG